MSMDHVLVCTCGEVMVKSCQNGTTKVRAKIFVFRDGSTYGVCKGCNKEVPVPVVLDKTEFNDLLAKSKTPRLFLKRL